MRTTIAILFISFLLYLAQAYRYQYTTNQYGYTTHTASDLVSFYDAARSCNRIGAELASTTNAEERMIVFNSCYRFGGMDSPVHAVIGGDGQVWWGDGRGIETNPRWVPNVSTHGGRYFLALRGYDQYTLVSLVERKFFCYVCQHKLRR